MKSNAICTCGFILLIVFSCLPSDIYAQSKSQPEATKADITSSAASQKVTNRRPKTSFVKMVDFYLRDGQLVFGKLVSEGKNKIIIERLIESTIVVSTYSNKEIDSRTVRIKNIPESKYYLDLAEYFSSRTWDFRNDPDDFIQSIRCYEKAKQLLTKAQNQNTKKIEQIDKKIKSLQADRQVWIREVSSRAELKKLEFVTEIEVRINKLEDSINANNQQIQNDVADIKDSHDKLKEGMASIAREVSQQLNILEERIEANRRLLDRIDRTRYYRDFPVYPRR